MFLSTLSHVFNEFGRWGLFDGDGLPIVLSHNLRRVPRLTDFAHSALPCMAAFLALANY